MHTSCIKQANDPKALVPSLYRLVFLQVLEQLKGDHPLPSMILEHRSRQKLPTGFLTDICSRVKRPYIGPSGKCPMLSLRCWMLCSCQV